METEVLSPVESVTSLEGHEKIDVVAAAMKAAMNAGAMIPVSMEPASFFTPGLYIRELPMQANAMWVSKIHRERHPYFILCGRAAVWTDDKGWREVVAPTWGITEPGTRRVIWTIEDTVWITVHHNPTDTGDLGEIENRIIEPRDLPDALDFEQLQTFIENIQTETPDAISE